MRPVTASCLALAAVVASLVLAGCTPRVIGTTTPGLATRTIRRVEILGNQHLSDGTLLAGLTSQPARGGLRPARTIYDPTELELDVRRIVTTYQRHGYFAARVTSATVRPVDASQVDLRLTIEEGEASRVEAIVLRGAPGGAGLDEAALAALLGLRVGDRFDHDRYLAGKRAVAERLAARGHAWVEVRGEIRLEPSRPALTVTVDVDAGPLVRFGPTRVVGLARVPEAAVRARLAWREGDVVDAAALAATEADLVALGRFAAIDIEVERAGRPAVAAVTITVSEAGRREERVGVGLGFDSAHYEGRLRGGLARRGFLSPLTTVRADGRVAYTVLSTGERLGFAGAVGATLEQEDLLWPRLRGAATVELALLTTEAYTLAGPRVRLGLSHPRVLPGLGVGASWQLAVQSFEEVDEAIGEPLASHLGLRTPYRLGAFEQRLTLDRRDDPLDAHRGFALELRVEEGGAAAGGAFAYVKLTPEARGYLPLGRHLVLAARLRGGHAWAAEAVPITERYFGGGATSQRGFAPQRLAPVARDADGRTVAVGGEGLLEASVEARIERGAWGGVLFLDGGDVTAEPEALDPLELHWAAGLGLRWASPAGELRVDVGVRLNRTGPDEPEPGEGIAFHLGLGEAF